MDTNILEGLYGACFCPHLTHVRDFTTLGPLFRRFRKITQKKRLLASSWLAVCPSVRVEQLGSQWTDFHEI